MSDDQSQSSYVYVFLNACCLEGTFVYVSAFPQLMLFSICRLSTIVLQIHQMVALGLMSQAQGKGPVSVCVVFKVWHKNF